MMMMMLVVVVVMEIVSLISRNYNSLAAF